MSAARILNPAVLTELCKMRATPASVSRNMPCGRQLNRIKRDLFGPVNPVETTKIFNEELEKHQEKATQKWGFDFRTGVPAGMNSQFVWEPVSFQESSFVPEMYTLTRAAHVRPEIDEPTQYDVLMDERSERANLTVDLSTSSTDESCCDHQLDANVPTTPVFKVPAAVDEFATNDSAAMTTHCGTHNLRKRQKKITEYMKERKRLSLTPKKASPAKRMRLSPQSGSSHSLHSAHAHSIGSPLTLRSSSSSQRQLR